MNIFKGMNKQSLSASQCNAAQAVFGPGDPDVEAHCGTQLRSGELEQIGKEAYKALMTDSPIADAMQALQDNLTALVNELMTLDERLESLESSEQQRKDNLFFTPRGTRMMMSGDNWESGTKVEPTTPESSAENGSWVDAMNSFSKRHQPNKNTYRAHDLRQGKIKSRF